MTTTVEIQPQADPNAAACEPSGAKCAAFKIFSFFSTKRRIVCNFVLLGKTDRSIGPLHI